MDQLLATFRSTYGTSIVLGYGLRDVRCAGAWATAWTDPDPNDPDLAEPTPILFERDGAGAWVAVGDGEDNGCLSDVPQEHWETLAC